MAVMAIAGTWGGYAVGGCSKLVHFTESWGERNKFGPEKALLQRKSRDACGFVKWRDTSGKKLCFPHLGAGEGPLREAKILLAEVSMLRDEKPAQQLPEDAAAELRVDRCWGLGVCLSVVICYPIVFSSHPLPSPFQAHIPFSPSSASVCLLAPEGRPHTALNSNATCHVLNICIEPRRLRSVALNQPSNHPAWRLRLCVGAAIALVATGTVFVLNPVPKASSRTNCGKRPL
ncbi:hypothetical protein DFH09DRAFT_1095349 [Mycena vulgaris]|nr:hypothetical protein DFH09DRAFT_1095349 [Mycena vulgaris]